MKYFLLLSIVALAGCQTKKDSMIPSTVMVSESLKDAKKSLEEAGEGNSRQAIRIDNALSLAEQLDQLLEKIEKGQK